MAAGRTKSKWVLGLLLLAGVIVGGLITEFTKDVSFLSFLSFGRSFGIEMDNPFVLDLFVIKLKFAFQFRLDVATLLGLLGAGIAYRKWF